MFVTAANGRLRVTSPLARSWRIVAQHVWPTLFTAGVIALAVAPEHTLRAVPDLYAPLTSALANVSVWESLPPHPTTLSTAWQLGELRQRVRMLSEPALAGAIAQHAGDTEMSSSKAGTDEGNNAPALPDLLIQQTLAEAGALLGRKQPLTLEQLEAARALTFAADAGTSWLKRAMGIFSYTNIIWALALVGVVATVVPVAKLVAQRVGLLAFIVATLQPLLALVRRAVLSLWFVVKRLLRVRFVRAACHAVGLPVLYFLAFQVFVHAMAYSQGGSPRTFTMLAGLAVAVGLLHIPTILPLAPLTYDTRVRKANGRDVVETRMAALSPRARDCYIQAIAFSLAHLSQSTLIAYLALASVYTSLGFVAGAFHGGFFLGFDDEGAMSRAAGAALVLVTSSTVAHALAPAWFLAGGRLHIFASPLQVLGNVVMFLGVLIGTAWGVGRDHYWSRQLRAALLFAISIFCGLVLDIPELSNTATVFLVLWSLSKTADFGMWQGGQLRLMIFGTCLLAWRGALYLHTHPWIVVRLFAPAEHLSPALLPVGGGAAAQQGVAEWHLSVTDGVCLALAALVYALAASQAWLDSVAHARAQAAAAARAAAAAAADAASAAHRAAAAARRASISAAAAELPHSPSPAAPLVGSPGGAAGTAHAGRGLLRLPAWLQRIADAAAARSAAADAEIAAARAAAAAASPAARPRAMT